MAGMVKPGPDEVAKAFRKIAKDLGCDKSEERFRETLFAIGRQKIRDADKLEKQFSKQGPKVGRRTNP
jgi:hypothetical protein